MGDALNALIYGLRDVLSGAAATALNRRSRLWFRHGFTTTDDDEEGRIIVDTANIADDGTKLTISRKRIDYDGLTDVNVYTLRETILTTDNDEEVEPIDALTVDMSAFTRCGIHAEALIVAAWDDASTGFVKMATMKPSKQFYIDPDDGVGSYSAQVDQEDASQNDEDTLVTLKSDESGDIVVEVSGLLSTVAPSGVRWSIRLDLTVVTTPSFTP